jgi:uncharacterized OB-fold protein
MIGAVRRDAATAQFLDGTAVGEFRLKRSLTTGEFVAPQCVVDSAGQTDFEWVAAAGTGRVVSWAVIYPKPRDGVQTPSSVVAIVQLDEGPWWWCELLDADPAAMRVDLGVEAAFVRVEGSEETVPVFRVTG